MNQNYFGYKKGAFTGASTDREGKFQAANGGTLFLDEVSEMPLDMQPKLLRVLETGEVQPVGAPLPTHVDVRVIAATNKNLKDEVRAGKFRSDLYYRLAGLTITVPPLREREEDVKLLAIHFVRTQNENERVRGILPAALKAAMSHVWPGNVRELKNVVKRAALLSTSRTIEDLEIDIGSLDHVNTLRIDIPPSGISWDNIERSIVMEALRVSHWVQKDAADLIGLSPRVINYKVKTHKIKNPRWHKNKGSNDV